MMICKQSFFFFQNLVEIKMHLSLAPWCVQLGGGGKLQSHGREAHHQTLLIA